MTRRSAAFFAPLRVFLIEMDVEQRDRIEGDLRRAGFLDIVALPNVATAAYLLDRIGCDVVIAEFGADFPRLVQLLAGERHTDTFVIALEPAATAPEIRLDRPAEVDIMLSRPVSRPDLLQAVEAFHTLRRSRNAPAHGSEVRRSEAARV